MFYLKQIVFNLTHLLQSINITNFYFSIQNDF